MSFAYVPDSTEYGMVGNKIPPAIILHGGKVLSPGASPRRPMLNNVRINASSIFMFAINFSNQ